MPNTTATRARSGSRWEFLTLLDQCTSAAVQTAREIKTLVGASAERVNAGSKLVDEAGRTMTLVVDSIKKVAAIMGEITSPSHEQSAGISEVNQAVTQMDDITQQNAALVEQAAAAESLQEQAQALIKAVAIFCLRDAPSDRTVLALH